MGDTTTIRVSRRTYELVKDVSEQMNETMQNTIEKAIEEYRKKKFFEEMNAAFFKLKEDPGAWAAERTEREAWDVALGDGLEESK